MRVELLHITPLEILVKAIRVCHKSEEKSDSEWKMKSVVEENYELNSESWCVLNKWSFVLGKNDKKIIKKIIKLGHTSTLEHIITNWHIKGISRGCLQQLVRHRIASYSVMSTRYTLTKQLKYETEFVFNSNDEKELERIKKYLVLTGNFLVDQAQVRALEETRKLVKRGYPNDDIKYTLPEAFKTELVWTVNFRSLRNFLDLRLSPKAHWEIYLLAKNIVSEIPKEYYVLIEKYLRKGEK